MIETVGNIIISLFVISVVIVGFASAMAFGLNHYKDVNPYQNKKTSKRK